MAGDDIRSFEKLIGEDLNILLVCPLQYALNQIQKTILDLVEYEKIVSRVHLCSAVNDVLVRTGGRLHEHVDFVVFVALAENTHCLENIEKDLNAIEPRYPRSRMCIASLDVNYSTPLKPTDLWDFAKFYQLNLLVGSIKDEHQLQHLCERILRLVKVGCGFHGISFPTKLYCKPKLL